MERSRVPDHFSPLKFLVQGRLTPWRSRTFPYFFLNTAPSLDAGSVHGLPRSGGIRGRWLCAPKKLGPRLPGTQEHICRVAWRAPPHGEILHKRGCPPPGAPSGSGTMHPGRGRGSMGLMHTRGTTRRSQGVVEGPVRGAPQRRVPLLRRPGGGDAPVGRQHLCIP